MKLSSFWESWDVERYEIEFILGILGCGVQRLPFLNHHFLTLGFF